MEEELCREPYEDFEIAFYPYPAGTPYAVLGRRYRELQLARGAVKPLRDRVADNPTLAYAATAPEIRIRQAWKPVPSPVPHQQPENEPPVHVAATFQRVCDISTALRAAGVEKAELCLVGWNIGGHDGRWPQSFPAEPLLGGDAALRKAVAAVRDDGYLIVPHGNFRDGYAIADFWDAEWVCKGMDGLPEVALVAVLDADKEGFLRSETSLIQTAGRAARHVRGRVILYAETVTDSMRAMMEVTESRRSRQLAYNKEHGITPRSAVSEIKTSLVPGAPERLGEPSGRAADGNASRKKGSTSVQADSGYLYDVEAVVSQLRAEMLQAAEELDFETAAELRDQIRKLRT